MELKRASKPEDLFLGIAITLLLSTPLVGGNWWWPLIVVTAIIALVYVLKRRPRQIDKW